MATNLRGGFQNVPRRARAAADLVEENILPIGDDKKERKARKAGVERGNVQSSTSRGRRCQYI